MFKSLRLRSIRRASLAGFLLTAVILASVSCGSGDEPLATNEDTGSGSGSRAEKVSVTIVAEDNTFQPDEISASPGAPVAVTLQNKGDLPHTFTIRDLDVDTGTVAPGESAEVEFEAPESDLMFVCSIHELQGQTGQLVVE